MVKWLSKRGREQHEPIKQALLSGDWGNLFAGDFDPSEDGFDYKGLRESNPVWVELFAQKQFQQNVKNMIQRLINDHGMASDEANDLGGRRRAGGGDDEADEIGIELADLSLATDPRRIKYPVNIAHHGNVLNSDAYCTLTIFIFPLMAFYAYIRGRKVRVEQVADPIQYGAQDFLRANPEFNCLEGGAFIQAYAENGREIVTEEGDRAYQDRIRWYDEWEMDFDCEQNFQGFGNVRSWKEDTTPSGLRMLILNVVQKRDNHHENNAAHAGFNYFPQPPQQPFYQGPTNVFGGPPPVVPPPAFGGTPPTNFPSAHPTNAPNVSFAQQSTPRQSNNTAFQHYSAPSTQQQNFSTPPMQQQQQQQQQFSSPSTQQPHFHHQQQQQQQQFHATSNPQPPQPPQKPNWTYYQTGTQPFSDPSKPTPGVPLAAGMPNKSSKVTVETVDESMSESEDTPRKKPAARGVPVKKKSGFFTQVKDTLTGNSSTDDSRSTHMRSPPHKYHVMNDNSESTTSL